MPAKPAPWLQRRWALRKCSAISVSTPEANMFAKGSHACFLEAGHTGPHECACKMNGFRWMP